MKKVLPCLILMIVLVACLPGGQKPEAATPTPEVFNPLPAEMRAFEACRANLASELGIDPLSITLVEATPVDWPDACLDLAEPDEGCAQVLTPGFRILLLGGDAMYEYHTNQYASSIRRVR